MHGVRVARAARIIGATFLALGVTAVPASAERLLIPSAGWHGRAIQEPHRHEPVRTAVAEPPKRWSAGAVAYGTGFHRPGGSVRVREVQLRLRRLGYRPGPVDGLFGPRTRAAVAWFQVKHGMSVDGRATLATVRHLRARTGAGFGRVSGTGDERVITAPREPRPEPVVVAAVDGGGAGLGWWWWPIALALVLPVLAADAVSRRGRRPPVAAGDEPAAPAPTAGSVLAYVLIPAEASDGAGLREHAAVIDAECAGQGLALSGVIADREDARLAWQRPGLASAVERLVAGEVDYLMVTRLADPGDAGPELRRLVKAAEGEIAIARWQRTPIDRPIGEREPSHG